MGIIYIFWVHYFHNSCLHGIQKLNCYNHVFKNYLQVLELDLNFVVIQVLESKWNIFTSIWFFFQAPQYWCGEHLNTNFWGNEICFHSSNHPQPLKNDIIFGDTFEVFFQVQMIWHKLLWKTRGRLKMPMKKN